MADAYTATVVGAIGLAFSILALLLIIVIIGWLILTNGRSRGKHWDQEHETRRKSLDSTLIPVEGPDASGGKKKMDRFKLAQKYGHPPQILRKNEDNLKEISSGDHILNGTKNGSRSTFENLDPPAIYKKAADDSKVNVIHVNLPAEYDEVERVIVVGEEHHNSETLKLSEVNSEVRQSFTTKSHGYYGPYAQEDDSNNKN